jgi:hypothetical protein
LEPSEADVWKWAVKQPKDFDLSEWEQGFDEQQEGLA